MLLGDILGDILSDILSDILKPEILNDLNDRDLNDRKSLMTLHDTDP